MPEIREARPAEAATLCALAVRSKAHWGYTSAFLDACRAELSVSVASILASHVYVLELDDVVGFYTLEPLATPRIELGHLFVEPEHIGRGYGRWLLDHARAKAKQLGAEILVIQGDPHAAAFYRSCGARHVGDRPSESIPGRVLPVFELRLLDPDHAQARGRRSCPATE